MSAPGLDLELLELLDLPATTFRTSVNFMGCYAALHALKMADAFCKADKEANVLIVCTELCTLHFQKENTIDNITSSMLFSDGAAAVLVSGDDELDGLAINNFYSTVALKGKQDMAWELSSKGFRMTLSSYVADMIEENFDALVENALTAASIGKKDISLFIEDAWQEKKIKEQAHALTSVPMEAGAADLYTVTNHVYEKQRLQNNQVLQDMNEEWIGNLVSDPYIRIAYAVFLNFK